MPYIASPFISVLLAAFLGLTSYKASSTEGEIITAYQDTQPKYFIDEKGNASGICPDLLLEIEAQDPSIRFSKPEHYLPIKRIYSNMKRGMIHVYCGAAHNQYRDENFVFSKHPLYDVSTAMVISKKSVANTESFEKLTSNKDIVFTTINGSSTERLLNKLALPTAKHFIRTVEQGMALAKKHPIEVFTYHSLGLKYALKDTNRWDELKLLNFTLRDYKHWLLYSKLLPELKREKIDNAILELKEKGTIDKILKKYQ